MANLNDVLNGIIDVNSKMAKNINTLLDSVGEGFLDIGSLTFTDNVLTLQKAVILANGSNASIENSSVELIGNKICLIEYKSDKTIGLVVVDISDENYTYDSSSLDSTSKYFEVAGLYEGEFEDLRIKGMASKDNSIVKAINGALKAIDYDDVLNLEINLDVLSRLSELEVTKADISYVDNAIANIDLPELDTNLDGVVTASDVSEGTGHISNAYLTKLEFKAHLDNLQENVDESLPTKDKTITGAIKELFTSANNGKQLIASAIGDKNINIDSTFNAMSEAITSKKDRISQRCQESSYIPKDNETFDSLSDILDISDIDINQFTKIACGDTSTFVLRTDSKLFSCGENSYYEAGIGSVSHITKFLECDISNVVDISANGSHAMLLRNDGTVWACGRNDYGQLGRGNTTNSSIFIEVFKGAKSIACSYYSSYIVDTDGYLWACGRNDYGQLGLGDLTNSTSLINLNISNVDRVFCGYYHVFIRKTDGTIWSCGRNDYGQLGLGDLTNRKSFTKVDIDNVECISCGLTHTLLLKKDSYIYACGRNNFKQLGEIGINSNQDIFINFVNLYIRNVQAISCGRDFSMFLKKDKTVWGCGKNDVGQLGLPACEIVPIYTQVDVEDVVDIQCGYSHSFIRKQNHTIWSCGKNNGRLGHSELTDSSTFLQVIEFESKDDFVTRNINNFTVIGNYMTETPIPENIFNFLNRYMLSMHFIDSIEDGRNTYFIKLSDGSFRVVGYNAYGQLGFSNTDFKSNTFTFIESPVANIKQVVCNSTTTIFLKHDGTVWSCGRNNYGQLGINVSVANNDVSVNILKKVSLSSISKLYCGEHWTIAVNSSGIAYGWGYDNYGVLGLGSTSANRPSPVTLPLRNIVDVSRGGSLHAFYTLEDGTIWCSGYNSHGQLGLNNTTTQNTPVNTTFTTNEVAKICCTSNCSIMLKHDGTVWTCGQASTGCLGNGDTTTNLKVFTQIMSDVKDISACYNSVYALKNDGTVYGWGDNTYSQLTNLTPTLYSSPTLISGILNVMQVLVGHHTVYFLTEDRALYTRGLNNYGQCAVFLTGNVTTPTPVIRGI